LESEPENSEVKANIPMLKLQPKESKKDKNKKKK
jgi:hypothetical protein